MAKKNIVKLTKEQLIDEIVKIEQLRRKTRAHKIELATLKAELAKRQAAEKAETNPPTDTKAEEDIPDAEEASEETQTEAETDTPADETKTDESADVTADTKAEENIPDAEEAIADKTDEKPETAPVQQFKLREVSREVADQHAKCEHCGREGFVGQIETDEQGQKRYLFMRLAGTKKTLCFHCLEQGQQAFVLPYALEREAKNMKGWEKFREELLGRSDDPELRHERRDIVCSVCGKHHGQITPLRGAKPAITVILRALPINYGDNKFAGVEAEPICSHCLGRQINDEKQAAEAQKRHPRFIKTYPILGTLAEVERVNKDRAERLDEHNARFQREERRESGTRRTDTRTSSAARPATGQPKQSFTPQTPRGMSRKGWEEKQQHRNGTNDR